MSNFIDNLTRRINGGIRHDTLVSELSSNTGSAPTMTTGTITGGTTSTITTVNTLYNPPNLTVSLFPSTTANLTYNPTNFGFFGSHYNIENINIDALRKFIVNEISFVDNLIEIDDSDTHICKLILSVNKEMYGELEVDYIFDKVEDYIQEKISGLISCMDPNFDQGRINIMFIPKSTLLDIIKNDEEN